jgi:hypothetical protein
MTKTITGLFDSYQAAKTAVTELEAIGVSESDISIVANNADNRYREERPNEAAEGAGEGAGVGAVVGGVGGLLTGLGIMAIPGVGPVVAAGWLVATAVGAAAGAAVGGATGGIIGSMIAAGVPERDAHVYAEGVKRGGTLVTARVHEELATVAETILAKNKAVDPGQRRKIYEETGWTRFDENTPTYTTDEITRERELHR